MQTLDAPIYEVKQSSGWYKSKIKHRSDINDFFDAFEKKFGFKEGFSFYHFEYFGVYGGTEVYEFFKNELVKNADKDNWYAFKKRSKYFKEIKELIEQIEKVNPFKLHDVLGLDNVSASQWLDDRWFFGVKNEKHVKGDEVVPIDYKDYLSLVMSSLD